MRIAVPPLVIAVAGLAVLEASATPIRVVAISSHIEVIPNAVQPGTYRVGLAGAPAGAVTLPAVRMRKGCTGGMRGKALELSNTLRSVMGLPAIEGDIKEWKTSVMPSDGKMIELHPSDGMFLPHPRPMRHSQPLEIEVGDRVKEMLDETIAEEPSFIERIHAALVELGPWEARAVAFVLGCGIGVLLRMVWIFAVLVVRELNPSREETASVEEVRMLAPEVEELPEYSDDKAPAYTDEKATIA